MCGKRSVKKLASGKCSVKDIMCGKRSVKKLAGGNVLLNVKDRNVWKTFCQEASGWKMFC